MALFSLSPVFWYALFSLSILTHLHITGAWSSQLLHDLRSQLASLHSVHGLQPRLRLATAILRTAAALLPLLRPLQQPLEAAVALQQHMVVQEQLSIGLSEVTLLLLELPFAALIEGSVLHSVVR